MTTLKEQFTKWMEQNQLLYISLVKAKDGKKVIWGRILQFDEIQSHLLIYLDDEKKTYHITLNEIEDITPAGNKAMALKGKIQLDKAKIKANGSQDNTYQALLTEAREILSDLSFEDLLAVLPILQHLKTKK